jgi:pyridoxamine 5'-phosphate oxidase
MTNNEVIAALRKDYRTSELLEEQVDKDPVKQFRTWFANALEAQLTEPNAMSLSTVHDNKPESRIVLLKSIHDNGFVFFTNYHSAKGHDMQNNPHVSLNFVWLELERQVRINGVAERVSAEESDAYFYSRPFESQVGAIVSSQSEVLASRAELEKAMEEALKKYAVEKPVRPAHWGGYMVKPDMIEFWQGRSSRLHDRLKYMLTDGEWKLSRLYP